MIKKPRKRVGPIVTAPVRTNIEKKPVTPVTKKKAVSKKKTVTPKKVGRPSKYEASVDQICEGIAEGKSLVTILKKRGMPSYTRVMVWLQENEEFRDRYARAREHQADYMADEILAISDQAAKVKDSVSIQAARLRIDTRKWVASKLKPKKYGDRMAHAGDEDSPLLNKSIEVVFIDPDDTNEASAKGRP